jgi:hypothetical protein
VIGPLRAHLRTGLAAPHLDFLLDAEDFAPRPAPRSSRGTPARWPGPSRDRLQLHRLFAASSNEVIALLTRKSARHQDDVFAGHAGVRRPWPDGQRILAAGQVVDLVADQRTFEVREFALVVDPR